MTETTRCRLCIVGLAKIALGAVVLVVGTVLLAGDAVSDRHALAVLALGAAITSGGHGLCQLCCFPPRRVD